MFWGVPVVCMSFLRNRWFVFRRRAHVPKMSSSSIVPVVLWGTSPPTHCISCITTTYDQKAIVTGSTDGQLGVWDLRFTTEGHINVSEHLLLNDRILCFTSICFSMKFHQ